MRLLIDRIRRAMVGLPTPDLRPALDGLTAMMEQRGQSLELIAHASNDRMTNLESLLRIVEERTRTLESLIGTVEERTRTLESLIRVVEERTRTLEHISREVRGAADYQIDFLQKSYVEAASKFLDAEEPPSFNAASALTLETDYPIAVSSNDHINPESTVEGVTRPTFFVHDCIRVLGSNMRTLDLGAGGAGQVFEFAMNGVFAIGIDGSDFCRQNAVGYWPLLPRNLFTCDITKSFSLRDRNSEKVVSFDAITMWEVLEHLPENDLEAVFENITRHLGDDGYFMGSVSMLEYLDTDGKPYHITLHPRSWWYDKLVNSGFEVMDSHPFNEHFFSRGNGPRYQDFHNYHRAPEEGFLFVARKAQLPLAVNTGKHPE